MNIISNRFSMLPDDLAIIIWKHVFQATLKKLRCNGIEHITKCGLCDRYLLRDESLLPITESYDVLCDHIGLPKRKYHCKCSFHSCCLRQWFSENRNLHDMMMPECNKCKKMILQEGIYFGESSEEEDEDEEDEDEVDR